MAVIVSRKTHQKYWINSELVQKKNDVFAVAVKVCLEMLKFIPPRMVLENKSRRWS